MKAPLRVPFFLVCTVISASLACNISAPTLPPQLPASPTTSRVQAASPTVPQPTAIQDTATSPAATDTTEAAPTAASAPTQAPATDTPKPASATSTGVPPTTASTSSGLYAVILVMEGDSLNVRKTAGATGAIVEKLAYNASGIALTRKETTTGNDRWVEIKTPSGKTGWANAAYLTETISPADFCADARVGKLLDDLKRALTTSDGQLLSSLVSPAHGWSVQYLHNGNIATYTPDQARWLFDSTYAMNWGAHPASGLTIKGSFHEEVLPKLLDVFNNQYDRKCNQPELGGANYQAKWPAGWANIPFYSLYKPGSAGNELDWRTLLVGVEYVGGKPYLFSLIHLTWEP